MYANNTAYIGTSGGISEVIITILVPTLGILFVLAGFAFVLMILYDAYTDWKISVVRKGTPQALKEYDREKEQ